MSDKDILFDPIIPVSGDEYEAEDRTRAMTMQLYDKNKKGIFTTLSTAETPGGIPLITSTKNMVRPRGHGLSDDMIVDAVSVEDAPMVYDNTVRGKVEDTAFPYADDLEFYGPLTDVPAQNNVVVMTERAGEFMSDMGVDVGLFSEELREIENIHASADQMELGDAAGRERESVSSLKRQLAMCRIRITHAHPEWQSLSRPDFIQKVMEEGAGNDGREYLELTRRFATAIHRIGVFSAQIMSDTVPVLHRPERVGIESLLLPDFDPQTEAFKPEKLTFEQVIKRANDQLDASPLDEMSPESIGVVHLDTSGLL